MSMLKNITKDQISELISRGCSAQDWNQVLVSDSFTPSQLSMCRFGGRVEIYDGAQVFNSTVINYTLAADSLVDSVSRLECTALSSFGNGVSVASLNECGGRQIKIYDAMSAQVAYIATIYRHREKLISTLDAMVERYATSKSSTMGHLGQGSQIIGARIVRNMWIDAGVQIEGSSALCNGTILSGAYIGADVKAHDFIAVENSRLDNGATIERCFVGENVIIANGYTALDSLFFASSHLENGEAASVFAGPYTVSHHKSSLLIAGMFSFFNAGSGSNQSNHLFKCGPVHQGVHLRGCKFGSSAYVMLPALNGAYTTVIGSHSSHHDSSDFPFSYLVNKEGRSTIIPAANLSSYGYLRDVEKWIKRDKRRIKRDTINLEEHNPYITSQLLNAVNAINTLKEHNPEASNYIYKNLNISANNLNRGLTLYNKAIVASIGAMLSQGTADTTIEGSGAWVDLSGQYITKSALEEVLGAIEGTQIESLELIDERLRAFAATYNSAAYAYAYSLLGQLIGHQPSSLEIEQAIASSRRAADELRAMALRDKKRDESASMSIGYGLGSDSEEDRIADYNNVRGL